VVKQAPNKIIMKKCRYNFMPLWLDLINLVTIGSNQNP